MRLIHLLAAAAVVVGAGTANADDIPAIDCQKAEAGDEHAICASSPLLVLDAETSTLYEIRMMLPMLMGERGNARDAQIAFLKTRSACAADASCIASAYRDRISVLTKTVTSGMNEYCKLKGIC